MREILLNNVFGLIFIFSFLIRYSKNICNITKIEEMFCLLIRNNINDIEDLSQALELTLILR